MSTQPHPEQSPRRTQEHDERINKAVGSHNQVEIALDDLESLFIAALCVVRLEGKYSDFDEGYKIRALETLMEYGRGAVSNAKESLEETWKVTTGYLFGHRQAATPEATHEETP